jgi:hypothetical protein
MSIENIIKYMCMVMVSNYQEICTKMDLVDLRCAGITSKETRANIIRVVNIYKFPHVLQEAPSR